MEMGQRVRTVVVGVVAWTVTFIGVRKILSKRSFDFCNRVVSLIHVAVALWLCSVSVEDWKHPLQPLASPAAPLQCGSELTGCLWLMEISNPFMHMRELLKELGYKDSRLSLLNDICFAFIFTLARLMVGPYLVYLTITANNPLIVKVTSVGLQVVSIFWFYKIAKMVQYKIAKAKKSQKTL